MSSEKVSLSAMPDFSDVFVLTDLDGTLLNSTAAISPENAAAARYLMDHGGRFTFATGRSLPGARHFIQDIPVNAPAVLCNGSLGYDFAAEQAVYTWDVDTVAATALMEAVASAFPACGIEIIREDGPWIVKGNALVDRHIRYTKVPKRLLSPGQIPKPWVSLGLLMEPDGMAALVDFVRQGFGEDFFIQQSMPHFLEIQRPGASKGAAILEICRQLGVPREHLYTIGDGTNDIELLGASPNAFAPLNACQAVLDLGPTLLPGNDDHIMPALVALLEARRA